MLAQAMRPKWVCGSTAMHIDRRSRHPPGGPQRPFFPQRKITTGVGVIDVQATAGCGSTGDDVAESFSSKICRLSAQTRAWKNDVPGCNLKGVSTAHFSEALAALVGPQAEGLSASTVTRLKQVWEQDN